MTTQRSLFDEPPEPPPLPVALAEGRAQASLCEEAAERRGWDSHAAGDFILAWLKINGPTAGEVLVTEASRDNPPHDGRAFGPVFMRLKRAGLIEQCGVVLRAKGHGCSGGRIWRLVGTKA